MATQPSVLLHLNRLAAPKHSPTERVISYPERQEAGVRVQMRIEGVAEDFPWGYTIAQQTGVEKSDRLLDLAIHNMWKIYSRFGGQGEIEVDIKNTLDVQRYGKADLT